MIKRLQRSGKNERRISSEGEIRGKPVLLNDRMLQIQHNADLLGVLEPQTRKLSAYSVLTRHMTAAAATLKMTTPSSVDMEVTIEVV